MKIEKVEIDLKSGRRRNMWADVQREPDATHNIYTLNFEGYQTEWAEVK